jgi:four helix bundle protein
MKRVERFEDLRVWQGARSIAGTVYGITSHGAFSRDFALRGQIRSAANSISSNIAEGFARRSNKEFVRFLFFAKGSVAEVESQLYLTLDQGYVTRKVFREAYDKLESVARQLSRLITYLKGVG